VSERKESSTERLKEIDGEREEVIGGGDSGQTGYCGGSGDGLRWYVLLVVEI
jgi:hypothetical protein